MTKNPYEILGVSEDASMDEFKREKHVDLSRDPAALGRVREAAEQVKKELSGTDTARKDDQPIHMEVALTRAKFDQLTADLVERTAVPVQNTLRDAGISPSELGGCRWWAALRTSRCF